jgi:hypothetical protein
MLRPDSAGIRLEQESGPGFRPPTNRNKNRNVPPSKFAKNVTSPFSFRCKVCNQHAKELLEFNCAKRSSGAKTSHLYVPINVWSGLQWWSMASVITPPCHTKCWKNSTPSCSFIVNVSVGRAALPGNGVIAKLPLTSSTVIYSSFYELWGENMGKY